MSVKELYERSIKSLPTSERYQLATMILSDIPPQAVTDYSGEWTEEDLRDFSRASWKRIETDPELEYDDQAG
jgi:hypothetical protein